MKKGARRLFKRIMPEDGISRQKGITMLFSFLLASTLWFLVIINQKDHQSSFMLPVFVHNLPQNVDYNRPIPQEIEVTVEGYGVDLMVQHFRYRADTVQMYYSSDRNYLLSRDYFSQIVQKTPSNPNIKVLYVSPDTIPIQFEYRTRKRVKLVSRANLQLAPSFQKESERIINIDSVTISGPQSMLDSISVWYTMQKDFFVEKEKERFVLPIDTLAGIQVSPVTAILEVETRAYTQKQIVIHLSVTDLPDKTQVHFSSESVMLSCLVPLKNYHNLKSSYELIIPFHQLNENIPYFIPDVERVLPSDAKVVTRKPFQIDFFIVEELNLQ